MDKSKSLMLASMEASEDFKPKILPQLIATLVVGSSSFSLGTVVAWSSPSLPDIEMKGVFPDMTLENKSWIISLVSVGALLSGPFSGYSIDKFGRKLTIMILAAIMTLGWCFISSGLSILVMCIGRFITGFSIGGYILLSSVYLSEISEENIRGALMALAYVECGLGILFTYVMGMFASWLTLSIMNIFFPVFLIIAMFFMPETPIHLLNKGKKKEAGDALMWLRGADNFDQIQSELLAMQSNSQQPKADDIKRESIFKALIEKNNLKALILVMVLMMCQQLCGVNAVLFYALTIFKAAGSDIDPNICSIIIGVVIILAIFINGSLIDRAGRRILIILSELGMAASLFGLGTFFYLKKQNDGVIPAGMSLIPLISLVSFIIMYNVGAGPVPFLLMGELLESRVKGFGCAMATSFNWVLAFFVTKYFETLTETLEIHGCYFMFGVICIICAVFCIIFVPETKGKSLDEIQKLYFSK